VQHREVVEAIEATEIAGWRWSGWGRMAREVDGKAGGERPAGWVTKLAAGLKVNRERVSLARFDPTCRRDD
jgi:hypothetical protein